MKFAVHLSHTCRPTHWHWWRSTSYRFEIQGQVVGQVGPDRTTMILQCFIMLYIPESLRHAEALWMNGIDQKCHFESSNLKASSQWDLIPLSSQAILKSIASDSIECVDSWLKHSTTRIRLLSQNMSNQSFEKHIPHVFIWPWWGNRGHSCRCRWQLYRFTQRSSLWCFPLEFLRRTLWGNMRWNSLFLGSFFGMWFNHMI